MKNKILIVLSLLFAFTFLFALQLQRPLFAQECPLSCPMTGPLTSPMTPTPTDSTTPTVTPSGTVTPTTTPTPDPKHAYTISGEVTNRVVGFSRHGQHRQKPAKDLTVTAVNIFNAKTFTAKTDQDGKYAISPQEAGIYAVHVTGEAAFYAPPVRIVHDTNKWGKRHVDFQGFIFKKWD